MERKYAFVYIFYQLKIIKLCTFMYHGKICANQNEHELN
jgi:hypothetical protein